MIELPSKEQLETQPPSSASVGEVPVSAPAEVVWTVITSPQSAGRTVVVLGISSSAAGMPWPVKRQRRRAGTLQGRIWMSEDFDAPLPEFDEYMQ
jgi:hypothetical protein